MQEALILAEVVEVQDGNEAEREVLAVVAVPIRVGLVGEKVGEGENQRLPYSWEPSACQAEAMCSPEKELPGDELEGGWLARRCTGDAEAATKLATQTCNSGIHPPARRHGMLDWGISRRRLSLAA